MSPRRILITGASGFLGRHLVRALRARHPGAALYGLSRRMPDDPGCIPLACDLSEASAVAAAVAEAAPDLVFHLASLGPGAAAAELERCDIAGFVALCQALREQAELRSTPVRMIIAGSSAELGPAGAAHLPAGEGAPCEPASAYGIAKLRISRLALVEPVEGPLRISVARLFNLAGPGMDPRLSLGGFARRVLAVRRGEMDALECGPLDSRRDYVDARDAAAALLLIAEKGRAGELYHVASGESHRMSDLLDILVRLSGGPVPVRIDPARRSPGDIPDIRGDSTKLRRDTGWEPRIGIEQSLADLWAASAEAAG